MNKKSTLRKRRLRVKYAEADRVRKLLQSAETQTLSKHDVRTLLKILNEAYPARRRKSHIKIQQPLLLGIGIGIILVLGLALMT